jgi:hypothetical protein
VYILFTALTDRLKFYWESCGPVGKVLGIIYALFGFLTIFRDNFLLQEDQTQYATRKILPRIDWKVWALAFAVILIISILEGAYRAYRKRSAVAHRSTDFVPERLSPGYNQPTSSLRPASHNRPVIAQYEEIGIPATIKKGTLPKICIVQNKPRVEWLELDEKFIWHIRRARTSALGFVVPFYNDPQQSTPGARLEFAKVHAIFTEEVTQEKTIVPRSCWIEEEYDWTNLNPGDQKIIVLVLVSDKQEPIAVGTSRDYRSWYNKHAGECPLTEYPLQPNKNYFVELCLLGGGNGEFRQVSRFHLNLKEIISPS